jgi:hypothetical protein
MQIFLDYIKIFLLIYILKTLKLRALTRTYLHATAGELKSIRFNVESGEFYASYLSDPSVNAPSEIYLNQDIFYKDGKNNKNLLLS